MRLCAAETGTDGLAWLEANVANVAIIDLGLPDMDGIEVLKRVKAAYPATGIIVLTGNASLDSAIDATNWGAFSYILKPYEIDLLTPQYPPGHRETADRRSAEGQR